MKAVVFGGTGFIGSHVVEQLHLAGHHVLALVRENSNTSFLERLGVTVVKTDFSKEDIIKKITVNDVVYNCTADLSQNTNVPMDDSVEVGVTKKLIEATAASTISRFIQLSTIVIYDFNTGDPIDETYQTQPENPVQRINLKREEVVQKVGKKYGIETIILRPASTIGPRDTKSFFSRLLQAHSVDQFPLVGDGATQVSLVDTRDIGRAMEFLGTYKIPENDNGIYLVKGYDTTWGEFKKELDRVTGKTAKIVQLDKNDPSPLVKNLAVNRIWNDSKIRNLGFTTDYTLSNSIGISVAELINN